MQCITQGQVRAQLNFLFQRQLQLMASEGALCHKEQRVLLSGLVLRSRIWSKKLSCFIGATQLASQPATIHTHRSLSARRNKPRLLCRHRAPPFCFLQCASGGVQVLIRLLSSRKLFRRDSNGADLLFVIALTPNESARQPTKPTPAPNTHTLSRSR
jgi:hypothetical protein